jgi:hypothetical protein
MMARRTRITPGLYVILDVRQWSWLGVQPDFPRDGWHVNLCGLGVFVGRELVWRARRALRRRK